MSAHASGPWRYEPTLYAVKTDSGRRHIAGSIGAAGDTLAERDALGRMIAAAPEMLAALRDAVAALGGIKSDSVPESVRAAIAKAEGA